MQVNATGRMQWVSPPGEAHRDLGLLPKGGGTTFLVACGSVCGAYQALYEQMERQWCIGKSKRSKRLDTSANIAWMTDEVVIHGMVEWQWI